jgi:lysophospholipase
MAEEYVVIAEEGLDSKWVVKKRQFRAGGPELRCAYYPPAGHEMEGLLVFLNGHNDWIEKYSFLPHLLGLPQNWGFLTWDHRGQGASAGKRSFIESYDQFASDALAIIRTHYEGDNLLIIGHSMGGLIALYALLKGYLKPKALVLCSPLLALPNHPLPRFLYRPIAAVLSQTRFKSRYSGKASHKAFENNDKTQSRLAYMRLTKSPFGYYKPTFAWLSATFRAVRFVHRLDAVKNLVCPTLLLTGTDERVVDPRGFEKWFRRVKRFSLSVRRIEIAKARHEILNEDHPFQQRAIRSMMEFLQPYF